MENALSEDYLREIARQLSCPDGEQGIKTGDAMNINNIGMTKSAIDALSLIANDIVLEIGHGNGGHIAYLLSKAENIKYAGADISETIIAEAKKINNEFIAKKQVNFHLTDGKNLPFADEEFDKIFTVNTIYFWKNPKEYLEEIKRVLKPSGTIVIGFADKNFMQSLPFTAYGFTLYDEASVKDLLTEAGFKIKQLNFKNEQVQSSAGNFVSRDYYTVSAVL